MSRPFLDRYYDYASVKRGEPGMVGGATPRSVCEEAATLEGFRWMPGMVDVDGWRLVSQGLGVAGDLWLWSRGEDRKRTSSGSGIGPDLDDPATRGCFLELVREAWGDPEMSARGGEHTGWSVHEGSDRDAGDVVAQGASEAEALKAALKAAPRS